MAKWHEKLDVTDPERVIGQTPQGEPIWLDMRELLTSPSEAEELASNKLATQHEAVVERMARDVVDQGMLLLVQTLEQVLPDSTMAELQAQPTPKAMIDRISGLGFVAIQDDLMTVVKRHGKMLRSMEARVPAPYRVQVAKRVRQIVRGRSAKPA